MEKSGPIHFGRSYSLGEEYESIKPAPPFHTTGHVSLCKYPKTREHFLVYHEEGGLVFSSGVRT